MAEGIAAIEGRGRPRRTVAGVLWSIFLGFMVLGALFNKDWVAASLLVLAAMLIAPFLGKRHGYAAAFPIRTGHRVLGSVVLFVVAIALAGHARIAAAEAAKAKQERIAEEAETRREAAEEARSGLKCLSQWDGSHVQFVHLVKDRLRDPDSFVHEETRIGPADKNGDHVLIMKYRARNGSGGMNRSAAIGTLHANCDADVKALDN